MVRLFHYCSEVVNSKISMTYVQDYDTPLSNSEPITYPAHALLSASLKPHARWRGRGRLHGGCTPSGSSHLGVPSLTLSSTHAHAAGASLEATWALTTHAAL